MAECNVVQYAVPEGPPYYLNGPMKAIAMCQTHRMEVPVPYAEGELCPLGRIEKATEIAIAQINEAKITG